MKELGQISVVGLGLLGGSVALAIRHRMPELTVVGYGHRSVTRRKARDLDVATTIADDLRSAVAEADVVILATPIFTFEKYFAELAHLVRSDCIVTDVGSTKVLPHRWAQQYLNGRAAYVGSHPIAGSEQSGIEFARDDLFDDSRCILTASSKPNRSAMATLKRFWTALGCRVATMTPTEHDRVFADISHLPHLIATGLVNASDRDDMKFAGKGYLDSTRIASGPASIWTDVLLANAENLTAGIDRVVVELSEMNEAVKAKDAKKIEALLDKACRKRAALVKYKIRKKELLK